MNSALPDFNLILGPNGPLARVLGEYEHRLSQIVMAQTVWQAIHREQDALIEAGTGTGPWILGTRKTNPALNHGYA